MRILQVTPYCGDAWGYGGIPRVVAALTNGLARAGHQVTVCATDVCDASSRLPLRDPSTSAGQPTVRLFRNLSNRLAYHLQLFMPLGMQAFLESSAAQFDIAHLHGCHHLPGSFAAKALRRAGVPYVLTPNGTAGRIERRRLAKWAFDVTLGRGVLEGAARLIATTEVEKSQLCALGAAAESIEVLPNPLELNEFEPAPNGAAFHSRVAPSPGPLLLFLGKLTPRKGVEVLVRAFAELEGNAATLVIAGNDLGVEPGLSRLVRQLGLDSRIKRIGLLRGRARLEALAAADVVVYPSKDEIFGLVPLEAILCGAPVIVSDDSGCGEIIENVGGGLLSPQGDPTALAEALRRVLANQAQWRAAALAAQPKVRKRFGSDAVSARHLELYARLVRRRA